MSWEVSINVRVVDCINAQNICCPSKGCCFLKEDFTFPLCWYQEWPYDLLCWWSGDRSFKNELVFCHVSCVSAVDLMFPREVAPVAWVMEWRWHGSEPRPTHTDMSYEWEIELFISHWDLGGHLLPQHNLVYLTDTRKAHLPLFLFVHPAAGNRCYCGHIVVFIGLICHIRLWTRWRVMEAKQGLWGEWGASNMQCFAS